MSRLSFTFSRKMPVMLDDYRSADYFCSITKEYSEEEMEMETIVETEELKELSELVDMAQRNIIKKETGITMLMIDELRINNEEIIQKKKYKIKNKE